MGRPFCFEPPSASISAARPSFSPPAWALAWAAGFGAGWPCGDAAAARAARPLVRAGCGGGGCMPRLCCCGGGATCCAVVAADAAAPAGGRQAAAVLAAPPDAEALRPEARLSRPALRRLGGARGSPRRRRRLRARRRLDAGVHAEAVPSAPVVCGAACWLLLRVGCCRGGGGAPCAARGGWLPSLPRSPLPSGCGAVAGPRGAPRRLSAARRRHWRRSRSACGRAGPPPRPACNCCGVTRTAPETPCVPVKHARAHAEGRHARSGWRAQRRPAKGRH